MSIKRLGTFLQNKDLDEGNVFHYPQNEQTGNSILLISLDIATLFLILSHCEQNNALTRGNSEKVTYLKDAKCCKFYVCLLCHC